MSIKTLEGTPDGEDDINNVVDRAEALSSRMEIDLVDVTGGIAEAQEYANSFHEIPASGYTLPAIGYIALRKTMPPFNQSF